MKGVLDIHDLAERSAEDRLFVMRAVAGVSWGELDNTVKLWLKNGNNMGK